MTEWNTNSSGTAKDLGSHMKHYMFTYTKFDNQYMCS